MKSEKKAWVLKYRKNQKPERKEARGEETIGSSEEVGKPVGGCLNLRSEVGAASSYAKEECGLSTRETETASVR